MSHPDDSVMTKLHNQRQLYEAAAELFKVDKDTLSLETRLDELGSDEHSLEELLIAFEHKLTANHADKKQLVSFADLSGAETLGDVIERINDSRIG